MWQMICLCPPAVTKCEQQRIITRFNDVLPDRDAMDIGLHFLQLLSPDEALTVLEEKLDLVKRSQELLENQSASHHENTMMHRLIHDHMLTIIAAESDWLHRTITYLRTKDFIQLYV